MEYDPVGRILTGIVDDIIPATASASTVGTPGVIDIKYMKFFLYRGR